MLGDIVPQWTEAQGSRVCCYVQSGYTEIWFYFLVGIQHISVCQVDYTTA